MLKSKGTAPVRMNGLRVSDRLIRLEQVFDGQTDPRQAPFYQKLAADRINISFLCADYLGSAKLICCLVEPEILTRAGNDSTSSQSIPIHPDGSAAAEVSVFPHRFNPAAVGAILQALSCEAVPWHYMASSGSMLSFVIDYASREKAVDAIAKHIDLPEFHGPLCPGADYDPIARSLKIAPETVARYVESKIRTYGISVQTGLTLCRLRMPADVLKQWSGAVADKAFRFCYASAVHSGGNDCVTLEILLEPPETRQGRRADIMSCLPVQDPDGRVELRENAQMITFHGPHFGDRYGIADKALGGLESAGVEVWLSGCVGATVSIVIPPGTEETAKKALSEVFEIP